MKMSISEINWVEVKRLCTRGDLSVYIKHLPRLFWDMSYQDASFFNFSLVHYASGPRKNCDALILLMEHNSRTDQLKDSFTNGFSPLHEAIVHCNISAIQIIYTFSTNWMFLISRGMTVIDFAISVTDNEFDDQDLDTLVCTLISCGSRLKSVTHNGHFVSQKMKDFERGVLHCRDVIVILLGLKKRKQVLGKLDRFLVQLELAVAIWTTRQEQEWQKVK